MSLVKGDVMPNRVGDLEIEQDMDFQRANWRISRVAWVIMALILLAGLAGLLGSGPASDAQSGGPDAGIQVHYDRILRVLTSGSIEVDLEPGATSSRDVRLKLGGDLVRELQLERIEPEPSNAEIDPDGITYTFNANQPGQPGRIVFYGTAQRVGSMNGSIGLDQRRPVSLPQLVFP